MFNIFENIITPHRNATEIVDLITDILKINSQENPPAAYVQNHPDFPSLLSVSDTLTRYGIDNLAITLEPGKLSLAPTPFIAQVRNLKGTSNLFCIVKSVIDGQVSYFDPIKYQWKTVSKELFFEIFTGTILILEATDQLLEIDYDVKRKRVYGASHPQFYGILLVIALMLTKGSIQFFDQGIASTPVVIFFGIAFLGVMIGVFLVRYEITQSDFFISHICKTGRKVNCSAILNSKASRIAGISWSSIGLSYFVGQLLLFAFSGVKDAGTLSLLSISASLGLFYVAYSLFYQYFIAKQWCILCLYIQAILVLQCLTLFSTDIRYYENTHSINLEVITKFIMAFALPLTIIMLVISLASKAQEGVAYKRKLISLKQKPEIFKSMLNIQRTVSLPNEDLGIILGQRTAKNKIVKVCNPYCGPCAKAHLPIEDILSNNPDVQVQIIFTCSNHLEDSRTPPVKHLMAIAALNDERLTKKALDDWYLSGKEDYSVFAARYPMNEELDEQDKKIYDMMEWCNKTDIQYTPTFFVAVENSSNNSSLQKQQTLYQLPDIYSVEDLQFLLK